MKNSASISPKIDKVPFQKEKSIKEENNLNEDMRLSQNINSIKQQKEQQKQNEKEKQSFFDQYLRKLGRKVLKRKIILFLCNILLTLVAFVFCLFIFLWGGSGDEEIGKKISEIFNTQFSLLTFGFIIVIGVLGAVFSIVIIKGKVIMLHCYWISCLLFLIIFAVVFASAFSLVNMECEQPSSYILQKLKSTNQLGRKMFCSDLCPCARQQGSAKDGSTSYGRIQDCPEWDQIIYSSFFASIQQALQCSGWCSVNDKSYYTFYDSLQVPDIDNRINCFKSIQQKIDSDTEYFRILSVILCSVLVVVIFYTNYYIFMQKEDEGREVKKMKRKIQETQEMMEGELRTSKRMLS